MAAAKVAGLGACWLSLLSCGEPPNDEQPKKADVEQTGPLTWESLRFVDGDESGRRLLAARAEVVAAHVGWRREPLDARRGYLSERWSDRQFSASEADVNTFSHGTPRDDLWVELGTDYYNGMLPEVRGLRFNAGDFAARPGLSVSLSRFAADRYDSQMSVTIYDMPPGRKTLDRAGDIQAHRISISDRLEYTIVDTTLSVTFSPKPKEDEPQHHVVPSADVELRQMLQSPDAIAEIAARRYEALRTEVRRAVRWHQVYECRTDDPEESELGLCANFRLSADQEREKLATAEAQISGWIAYVADNAPAIHSRLVALVPMALLDSP